MAQRQGLYQNAPVSFDLVGTLSDVASTPTSNYSFTVEFQDACQSATIITSPGIGDANVVWDVTSAEFHNPTFLDSVDITGTYSQGVCGEKTVTLDPTGCPAFLTLQPDPVDPILNDFKLVYSNTGATEADIKMHTCSYSVASKEYTSIPSIIGTFQFEI